MELNILVVDDDELLASNIQTYLERKGYEAKVCFSAEAALESLNDFQPDVVFTDHSLPGMTGHDLIRELHQRLPDAKLIMMTGYGNIEDAVKAMRAGAFDYLTKPVMLSALLLLIEKIDKTRQMERKLSFYQERDSSGAGLDALIGESPAMRDLKGIISQLLRVESRMQGDHLPPVLIEGETGTGKELVARALHFDGPRAKAPFIEFNCASIPAQLLEAELFGHEKGAFTDAKERRIGLVEAADGGTLFLDEIGEMDLSLQAKLLKLLEDRTIRRVGSVREQKVDLRIISATNCNLEQMVQQGKFRRDLFFRLRIVSIKVPRLYLRGDDILLLARHFLAQHGRRYGKPDLQFASATEVLLRSYSWPGNVRELRNMLEQVVLLTPSNTILPNQLNLCPSLMDQELPVPHLTGEISRREGVPHAESTSNMNLPEVERDMVIRALDKTDWNVTKSARLLGLSRDMLRYRIEKLGLSRPGT